MFSMIKVAGTGILLPQYVSYSNHTYYQKKRQTSKGEREHRKRYTFFVLALGANYKRFCSKSNIFRGTNFAKIFVVRGWNGGIAAPN